MVVHGAQIGEAVELGLQLRGHRRVGAGDAFLRLRVGKRLGSLEHGGDDLAADLRVIQQLVRQAFFQLGQFEFEMLLFMIY